MRPEACAIAEQEQWLTRLTIEKWPEKIVGTRARANRKFSHSKYGEKALNLEFMVGSWSYQGKIYIACMHTDMHNTVALV